MRLAFELAILIAFAIAIGIALTSCVTPLQITFRPPTIEVDIPK